MVHTVKPLKLKQKIIKFSIHIFFHKINRDYPSIYNF